MGVLDTLGAATTGTVQVTLILDGALDAEWTRLSLELSNASQVDYDNGSLAMPATTAIVEQMEAIRERVEASQVTFDFVPMEWPDRLTLMAKHPAREGDVVDQMRGYNVTTYISALIKASCVKVTDQQGDESTTIPDSTWTHLLGDPNANPPVKPALAPGQVTRLHSAATDANQGASRVPPSARSLLVSQDSGASLAQPGPGKAPHRNGSEDGNRPGSPKSSTGKKAAAKKVRSSAS